MSAREAYERAAPGSHVIGWRLDREQRGDLLARFAAAYAQPVADHVTLRSRVAADSALPQEVEAEIVGRADDGGGVEAMVVSLGGTTERPDGGCYHITWSLGPGRHARESNDVIAARGWEAIDPPVPVRLKPETF